MEKLIVNIKAEGTVAKIQLIGEIYEWNYNNAELMRSRCTELKQAGATACNLYIMTAGGECHQASEIVNILNEIFGSYDCEGGALVASAGTYIAVNAKTFTIAKNGQFMIHKPSMWISGNENDVENDLTALKNLTKVYYEAYLTKLKKSETDFKAKWDNGDFWLSATETVEWGFADSVKNETEKLDEKTAMFIKALIDNNQKPKIEMSRLVTLLIAALTLEGISEQSTDEQVANAVQGKFNALISERDNLKTQAKAQTDNAIKAMLDDAQAKGKIVATGGKKIEDIRATYENIGNTSGIEALAIVLNGLQAPASITSQIVNGGNGNAETIDTFDKLVAKGEDFITAFKAEKPDEYKRLYKAEFGCEPKL